MGSTRICAASDCTNEVVGRSDKKFCSCTCKQSARRVRLSAQATPSGELCECGCGGETTISGSGYTRGKPNRFLPRHQKRADGEGPNPGGLCMCGCGEKAPVAQASVARLGYVAGKPVRYIRGHRHRLKQRYVVDGETECWVWQGKPASHGRGQVNRSGAARPVLAYRYVYEQEHGPIPDGHHLHHRCENPMCVNPAHLEPLTPAEHALRHKHRKSVS